MYYIFTIIIYIYIYVICGSILFSFFSFFGICMFCLLTRLCTTGVPGTQGGQKRMSEPLKLENSCQLPSEFWKLSLGPLQKQVL